jgi:hypothetical protein
MSTWVILKVSCAYLAARQHGDILQRGLAVVAEARGLDSHNLDTCKSTKTTVHQGRS